jgi:hypothetical protein
MYYLEHSSVSSIIIAPAETGNNTRRSRAVVAAALTNRGIHSGFILIVVEMKFTAPRIDDTPPL